MRTTPARHAARLSRPPATATPAGTFRPELHGVRGLALALVVIFHVVGDGRVSGGIDVFLAVTGFLFTGSLLRRAVKDGGRIDLAVHFGRLGQRLLPPAIVVLVAVAAATLAFMPQTRWLQVANELRATALYYENWELLASQLDYAAAGPGTSPLQHFWSLSVQGQFYLVAPFVVMAAVAVALRLRLQPRAVLIGVVGLVFAASFAYSVHLTAVDQQVAYFHTGTRLWELALGGLAALLLPSVRIGRRVRVVLGWLGLAMIVSCGFLIDGGSVFPGYAALWPVMGLVLVLAGGASGSRWGAERLLSAKPLTFVADISYSLYLWHWPVLIFFLVLRGQESVGAGGALVVLAISVLLAWASRRLIEDTATAWRFTASRRRKLAATVVTIAALGTSTGASASVLEQRQDDALASLAVSATAQPGAAALVAGSQLPPSGELGDPDVVTPSLLAIESDMPEFYARDCVESYRGPGEVLLCEDEVADPSARIVVTGGSHAGQWWDALEPIAAEQGWEVIVMEKGSCHLTDARPGDEGPAPSETCQTWNDGALRELERLRPDAVLTIGSTTMGGTEVTPPGFARAWAQLDALGIPVIAVRDTPRFEASVAECLAQEGLDAVACGQPREHSLVERYPALDLPALTENVALLDMTDLLCEEDYCPAIVGNVVVYRDADHVSSTYMRSLAPYLDLRLRELAPWLFAAA